MNESYIQHYELLKERNLSATQVAEVVDCVSSGLVSDIIPKLRSRDKRVKNEAVSAVATISCNALAGLYLLTSVSLDEDGEYPELPETDDVQDLLESLKRTSGHIAKIQDPTRNNEHTVFMEGEPATATILKCALRGAQRPTNIAKATLCLDAYIEQAHAANALIAILTAANPTLTSTSKFDKLNAQSIELLDEFSA